MPPTFLEQTFGTVGPSGDPYQRWLQFQTQYWASPQGQREIKAYDETTRLNRRELLAKLKAERDRIAIQRGEAAANKWYQQQQVKLAQQEHALKRGQALGYIDGSPTLEREQSQADVALRAAQLGASLRGPRDWATYLRTANDVAGSPASSFVTATPGGMGQNNVQTRRMTLADVLGDFGMGGGGSMVGGSGAMTGNAPGNPAPNTNPVADAPHSQPGQTWQQGQSPTAQQQPAQGAARPGLGLNPGEEQTLRGYFASPNSAPVGWLESKDDDQRSYLAGLADEWGYSWDTITNQYGKTRPKQGSVWAAY